MDSVTDGGNAPDVGLSPLGLSPLGSLRRATALELLRAIHRSPDSYVGFVRKPSSANPHEARGFENLGSISTCELEVRFPTLLPWLEQDSYFTVNGSYRVAPWKNRITGLPDVWRGENRLRRLNACFVDLDVGRPKSAKLEQRLTWWEAIGAVHVLVADGQLPPVSVVASSGRGAYVFWLLHDERDPHLPPRAWAETILWYKEINRAIGERLMHLAADPGAHDAARVLRLPDTLHSTARQPVLYYLQTGADGRTPTYALTELAAY